MLLVLLDLETLTSMIIMCTGSRCWSDLIRPTYTLSVAFFNIVKLLLLPVATVFFYFLDANIWAQLSLFAGFVLWYKRISDSDFCRQEETYILHICVLIFRVTFIQLIWRLVKQIACSYSFSFRSPGELWLYSLVFDLDLIWRVTFIHKTKLFSFYLTSTRFWCRVVWDGQPSLV